MTIHILLPDGSAGGTVYNVRAVEEENGALILRMTFSDVSRALPKGAYVNVEASEEDSDDE